MHLFVLWWESNFQSFHDSIEHCHYQRAWLVSSWLIRFSVGQVVLSGLPRSTSLPILWVLRGSAVSMQSWAIKEKSCWPPAVLWESTALASSAYLDQSGYKWTFISQQPCKDSPEPSGRICSFNIPYLKRPEFWEKGAEGNVFFPFAAEKNPLLCNVYRTRFDWNI